MPKFSVLIIEDEKNIQTFMGKVLKRHDYQVLYADTGKQGLEMIRSRCPDLILLDLGLPDMDGCSIIRDVRTWASTLIIVISARTAEREKVAALDLGADDYITKPFGTSELLARIRASLRHSNRLLTDSTFRWLGRYDNVINSGGIKIFPEELEEEIRRVAAPDFDFYIAADPHPEWGQAVRLVAEAGEEELDRLRAKLEATLDHKRLPKRYVSVDSLPRTYNNKLIRK